MRIDREHANDLHSGGPYAPHPVGWAEERRRPCDALAERIDKLEMIQTEMLFRRSPTRGECTSRA
jgi:hypothetical protein